MTRTQAEREEDWQIGRELERRDARIYRLEVALQPFCFGDPALEKALFGQMSDDAVVTFTIKLGDCRRAREALRKPVPTKGER